MAKQTKGKDTPTEPAVGTSVESLRERKRRETRAAIERSAITLVDELGYENVTVAMIAERAVVSQGTFFNYFPTKDAAIVGLGPLDLDPQAVHAAYDRLAPAAPYHATLSLFLEVVRELDWTSDIAAMRGRLVAQTPVLMRLFLDGTFAFVADFRSMLASYLEGHPERRTCSRRAHGCRRGEPGGVGGARSGEVRARAGDQGSRARPARSRRGGGDREEDRRVAEPFP